MTFSEKAAGELKLRLREELERARVAPADSLRNRPAASTAPSSSSKRRTSARFTGSAPSCSANARSRRGSIRRSRCSPKRRATGSSTRRSRSWMEAALQNPGEGVRRSLRRPQYVSWWRDSDDADGPIERLKRAGRELLQWRDHPAPWKRPEWDRPAMIDRVVESVLDVAARTADPIYERDFLFQDTASLRRQAGEIARAAQPSPRDYDGLEALLTTLAADRDLAKQAQGQRRDVLENRDAPGDARRARRTRNALADVSRRRERRPRGTAPCGTAGLRARLRGSQAANRHAGFSRPADSRARSGARLRAGPRGVSGALQVHPGGRVPGHGSRAGRAADAACRKP